MKILIFSWRGPGHPNAGGAEYVTHEHAKAWISSGHEVTLFTSTFNGAKKNEVVDGVQIVRSGGQEFGVKIKAFLWYFLKNRINYDLVVDHFHGIPFFTPLFVKTKKLAFIHEVTKNVWKFNPWPKPFNLIPYIIGTVFEPFIFRFLYGNTPFLTVSESTKKDLLGFGIPEKHITVIQNGVDHLETPKKLHTKEKKRTAMFLGAVSYDKGIDDALMVFNKLSGIDNDWRFWIIGKSSPDMKNYLRGKIAEMGLTRNTKYFGFVSNKRKFEFLSRAHVLINPSVREGWGLVNIEAASVGTPVVGYDVAGVRDSVMMNKTGVLCKVKTPECLAGETEKLLADKKRYINLCRHGIEWANRFNWEVAGQQSLELLKSIVV